MRVRWRHRRGGRFRRLAAVLVAVVVAITAVSGVVISRYEAGRETALASRFDTRHTTATRFMEAYLTQEWARQQRLALGSLTGTLTQARLDQLTTMDQYSSAVVFDSHGRVLAVSPAGLDVVGGNPHGGAGAIRSALNGDPAMTDIVTVRGASPLIGFVVPYYTPTGRRLLAAGHPVASTPLQPFVHSALSAFSSARVYLLDSTGAVIAADRPEDVGLDLTRVDPALRHALRGGPSGYLGRGDGRRYFVTGPVAGSAWQLVFSLDTAQLFQPVTPAQRWTPWAALACFLGMALLMIAMFVRALSGRARAEDEHARQQAILDTAGDAFIGMDDGGRVTDWNAAAARMLGRERAEVVGRRVSDLIIPPDERAGFESGLAAVIDSVESRLPDRPVRMNVQHLDGRPIPVELTVSRSPWGDGWRFHGFMRDITERVGHERQLRELALTDALTGLANRRAFLDRLEQAHARSRRHGATLVVVYADVDHFKSINDTYGHAAGDAILRQVSVRMRAGCRAEDTVGRLGGDEFAIVCEDVLDGTETLTARIRDRLSLPYDFRGTPIPATVSIGYAVAQPDEDAAQLLERADGTMYRDKAAHR